MRSANIKIMVRTVALFFSVLFSVLLSLLSTASFAQTSSCEYIVVNEWNDGYTASIRISNVQQTSIQNWQVAWQYQTNRVTNSWNAQLTGSNPYTAAGIGWNNTIQPGESVEFGIQVAKNNSSAERPAITGSVCTPGNNNESSVSSVAPVNSSSSSLTSSTASSFSSIGASSSVATAGSQCNWYGTLYPLCKNQVDGWGWEQNESCIGATTCSGQPTPYGIVGAEPNPSSSSSSSSSSSFVISSSSSSVASSSLSSASSSAPSSASSSASSLDPITNGCSGYATRFWDCCKPHCGWSGNVPTGVEPMKSCSASNQVLSDLSAGSSCEGGDAHTCYGLAPYAVSSNLSYGYAATSSGDVCGRCYQLEFTGQSHNAPGDPGSAALAGKSMIVQAINVGFDVGGGQFDIMIPGGGVGAFNGCSNQWGVSNSELGAQYGGFLSACKDELGYNASGAEYKSCVTNRCNNIFGSRGLTDLQAGCLWYADWFEAADNPALRYREVACPAELATASGMNRSALGDINNSCN